MSLWTVYVVRDVAGRLLFAGLTNDLAAAFTAHRKKARWYRDLDRLTLERYTTRGAALAARDRIRAAEAARECGAED